MTGTPPADPTDAWRQRRHPSPAGTYVFSVYSTEVRMSHWIDTPTLLRAATGEVIFEFSSSWSLDAARWQDETTVELRLRKYPGDHRPPVLEAVLDLAAGTATVSGGRVVALLELERALDDVIARG